VTTTGAPEDRLTIGGFRLPSTGALVLLIVGVAFALRLWELGERPFHHDESLDAWWSWKFRNGTYEGYDPVYHGPLRFYITAAFFELFGESEAVARLFSALSGTAVVGLPYFMRRELGRPGTIFAALALAVSPTMLYYSRFGREDAQMVFLTLLAMVLGLSYLRTPRISSATGLTFVLACSFAIKESTYLFGLLLAVFLMIVLAAQFDAQSRVRRGIETDSNKLNPAFVSSALLLATAGLIITVVVGAAADELFALIALYMAVLAAFVAATALPELRARRDTTNYEWPALIQAVGKIGILGWAIALGVFAVSWFLFFTVWAQRPGDWASGFTRAIDYWDSQQEVNRGGQPWYYYLYALPIYEWFFVALAFVGAWRGLRRPTMLSVLMVWFAVGSLILYSYAGERMPWLIAHPLLPILVLAAIGVQHLWSHRAHRAMPAVAVALSLAMLFTIGTSVRASFPNGADSREILSQAGQATPHLTAALERLDNIDQIAIRETGQPALLAIGTADAWPWSWYLRGRERMQWFNSETGPPTDGSVDVIIINRTLEWDSDQGRQRRDIDPAVEFPDYRASLFAMRSWWVPTYNDAGPIGWLRYARDRSLWEQQPNPGFQGVREVVETETEGGIGALAGRIQDGVDTSAAKWVGFTGADGELVAEDAPPSQEFDDGLDGCGSVDQYFLVHNRFAFSEAVVNPGPIEAMGSLDCASDAVVNRPFG
jgi:uncharacterized protein (TIGR03663 family)